jgi:hypothetical protein
MTFTPAPGNPNKLVRTEYSSNAGKGSARSSHPFYGNAYIKVIYRKRHTDMFPGVVLFFAFLFLSSVVTRAGWRFYTKLASSPLVAPVVEFPKLSLVSVVQAKEAVEVPKKGLNVAWVVDGIHMLETSKGTAPRGRHVTCKNKGLSNEYGYNPGQCFATHEEATNVVKSWVKRQYARFNDLNTTLCYYNTGKVLSTCQYSQDFHKVKGVK